MAYLTLSFAGVILAAGESSRMGQDKALLKLPGREETFLTAAIRSLRPHTQLVIVVAGANAESLKSEVYAHGAYLVVNPEPQRGQFSSLQIGLQEVLNRGRDAALITHVDRPPALPATLEQLLHRFESRSKLPSAEKLWAVIPELNGQHGHPIAIGREMIEAFLRAPATATAREIEHAHQARIEYLPVNDPNVTANINTPEDYASLGGGE